MRSALGRSVRAALVVAVLMVLLSGCGAQGPSGTSGSSGFSGSSGPPRPSASPATTPSPESTLDPGASAEDALAFFDSVNAATLAADPGADGRAFVDGLVAAGLDKARMELTRDQTTIGNAADSIQFSVRWGDSCLIGQNGSAVDGYHSTLAPVLGAGTCLIGSTRPIDW